MFEAAITAMSGSVGQRFWVISDLQQHEPAKARACLERAIEDFRACALPCDGIWYLGDGIEGANREALLEMSRMQAELLGRLGLPVRYVMGNHDLDYFRSRRREGEVMPVQAEDFPFRETISRLPGWRTTPAIDDFFFLEDLGQIAVVFLSDHVDPGGAWYTTHGEVRGDAAAYPHGQEAYDRLRGKIASCGKPVILASHYALSGGARPSELLNRLLPLPHNVQLHLHGHSHIGDTVWGGKDCHRKVAGVDNHAIPQVNISSLEDDRGSSIRSVILDIYRDRSFGVWFRNHRSGIWEDAFLTQGNACAPR